MRKSGARSHVLVTGQFLDCANVLPRIQQVRRKRMPQGVASGGLDDARLAARCSHDTLQPALVHVVTTQHTATRIMGKLAWGKHILPS